MLVATSRSISEPITKLCGAVTEVARGNLSHPIRSDREDEFGALSNAIGDMVDKISEHRKMIGIMDNLNSMVYVADMDYNLLYANGHLLKTYGLNKERAREMTDGEKCYKVIKNLENPCEICHLKELKSLNEPFPSKDYDYIWDERIEKWIGGKSAIIRWVDGRKVFFQAMADVTEKKSKTSCYLSGRRCLTKPF
ncbi:MAG: HAMP domain-containing protein [Helicobacteraceae bacterium]|jgi:HAMP domain-containing protein|nr:HAMP domain-containing protein [Helicobacteraceae bacterium]